jgi:very-short-patch-repair endonuclease
LNVIHRLEGILYFIDIAFERRKLAIEIDERIHATDLWVFESDRWRQNDLVASGWRVFRFTYPMVVEHPEVFIGTIHRALGR